MEDDAKTLVSATIQALLAVALIAALYYVSLYVSMQDSLVQVSFNSRSRVQVAPGIVDTEVILGTDKRLTASERHVEHLPQSRHQRGGVQFSYTFWMKCPDVTEGAFRRVLLLRGDPTPVQFTSEGGSFSLPLAFCPMVIVTRNAAMDVTLSVHVNTDTEVNFSCVHHVPNGSSPVNFSQDNLVTVSVADAFAYGSDSETSTSCSVWLNQVEYSTVAPRSYGGVRTNVGNLYILPVAKMDNVDNEPGVKVAVRNLEYTNYVLGAQEIYDKIARESNESSPQYQLRNTKSSGSQAFYDISMAHLSV